MQRLAQIAAAQPAHHQISAAWLAPIIVKGDDVRVFQPGNELGFCLKAADEIGLVGELGQDDFDGDFAVESRLGGAVNDAEAASADLLTQFVAANQLLCPAFVSLKSSGTNLGDQLLGFGIGGDT